jgi:hypothetical protein
MAIFFKSYDKNGSGNLCLKQTFTRKEKAKIKEAAFADLQISDLAS